MKLPPLGGLSRAARLPGAAEATALIQRALAEAGARMPEGLRVMGRPLPRPMAREVGPIVAHPDEAPAGRFVACRLGDTPQGRPYKLYLPSRSTGTAAPLLVMLHGCSQTPDDFAAGTGMNAVAEAAGCLVAYPEQLASANSARCWNWFNRSEQARDQGEPGLIAAITRAVAARHGVDTRRIYVAGLSAGGAAAAVLGATYPDLFAAIGVHTGLACGAARDASGAFAAMRDGADGPRLAVAVPAIVFHGDRDTTVNPRNGAAVAAQFAPPGLTRSVSAGQVPGGRAWERTVLADAAGRCVLEHWTVRGLGHAWSGGRAGGSHTDPTGPDASREMLRFFLEHRLA
jgi:poly(hydroxyalkanoate) depolymerase family esterase